MDAPEERGNGVAQMLAAGQVKLAQLACVAIDEDRRIPAVAAQIETGANPVGVGAVLRNVSHPIRALDGEMMRSRCFRHHFCSSSFDLAPVQFWVFKRLWDYILRHEVVIVGEVEDRRHHRVIDFAQPKHHARPSKDEQQRPEPQASSAMQIKMNARGVGSPFHLPCLPPALPERPSTARER